MSSNERKNDLKLKSRKKKNKNECTATHVEEASCLPDLSTSKVYQNNIDKSFYNYADNLDNPKKLTIQKLRSYKGLEKISDAIALEIIDGLYKLSIITYKIHTKNGTGSI